MFKKLFTEMKNVSAKALKKAYAFGKEMLTVTVVQTTVEVANKEDLAKQEEIARVNKLKDKKLPGAKQARNTVDAFSGYVLTTAVQSVQVSTLLSATLLVKGSLADKFMALTGLISKRVSLFKFSSKSVDFKSAGGEKRLELFDKCIDAIRDGEFAVVYKENNTSYALFGSENILTEISNRAEADEVVIMQPAACSPSGLRTNSLTLMATSINGIEKDSRFQILNKSFDGVFSKNFTQSIWNKLKAGSIVNLFKQVSRASQSSSPQKRIANVANYIVYNNFLDNVNSIRNSKGKAIANMVNLMDVINSKDGLIFIATEIIKEFVCGINFQARGGSLKCSALTKNRYILKLMARELKANGCHAVSYCVNGKNLTPKQFNQLDVETRREFMDNIDALMDNNAKKLDKNNGAFDITCLKVAKPIATGMSMVIAMILLKADRDATLKVIKNMVLADVASKMQDAGFNVEINENGQVVTKKFDVNKNSLSNDGMSINYLFSTVTKAVVFLFPTAINGMLKNLVKGLSNKLSILKVGSDALYLVIQSDCAPMYGIYTILNENEAFFRGLTGKEIAIARHPVSGPKAITILTCISIEEIRRRIYALDCSDDVKVILLDYYETANGFIIVPASNYHAEKHDGWDHDIDAIVAYANEEVVAIAKKIGEVGVQIKRSESDYVLTKAEEMLEKVIGMTYATAASDKRAHFPQFFVKTIETIKDIMPTVESGSEHLYDDEDDDMEDGTVQETVKKNVFAMTIETFRMYIKSGIASIGQIATGFYNNMCLLNILESKSVSVEAKQVMADCFKLFFECQGIKAYENVLKPVEKNGKTIITITKEDCINILVSFRQSYGTIADLTAFLTECLDASRYPAETAIDAAKNMYKVLDYFNFTCVFKALGSDKNMKFDSVYDSENKFFISCIVKFAKVFKFTTESNMFKLPTLVINKKKCFEIIDATGNIMKIEDVIKEAKESGLIPALNCDLGSLKQELVNTVNEMLCINAGLLEKLVRSKAAMLYRAEIRAKLGSSVSVILPALMMASRAIISSRDVLEKVDEVAIKANGNEKKGVNMATKEFEKNLFPSVKNLVYMSCAKIVNGKFAKDFTGTQIGLACIALSIKKSSSTKSLKKTIGDHDASLEMGLAFEGQFATVSTHLIKVFEKEISAAFKHLELDGSENLGLDWNRIQKVLDGDKLVDISTVVGTEVVDGFIGELEVKLYDKKALTTGTVEEVDGVFYIAANRNYVELDATKGICLPVNISRKAKEAVVSLSEIALANGTYDNLVGEVMLAQGKYEKTIEVGVKATANGASFTGSMVSFGASEKLAANLKGLAGGFIVPNNEVMFIGNEIVTIDEESNVSIDYSTGVMFISGDKTKAILEDMLIISEVATVLDETNEFEDGLIDQLEDELGMEIENEVEEEIDFGMPGVL